MLRTPTCLYAPCVVDARLLPPLRRTHRLEGAHSISTTYRCYLTSTTYAATLRRGTAGGVCWKAVSAVGFLACLAAAGPVSFDDIYDYEYYYDYYGETGESPALEPDGAAAEPDPAAAVEPDPSVVVEPDPSVVEHDHHHHGAEPDQTALEPMIAVLEPDSAASEPEGGIGTLVTAEEPDGTQPATEPEGGDPEVLNAKPPVLKVPERCTHPPDPGLCRAHFPMFYFDTTTRSCLQFVYGGCKGNDNLFSSAEDCYAKCYPVGSTRMHTHKQKTRTNSDDYLRVYNGRGEIEFTFRGQDAALKVDDSSIADFDVRNVYQLDFIFRTDSPHGLIAFLRQTSLPPELGDKMIQLYVFLRRGRLGVTHIFGHNTETFLMKKGGLQGGNWHASLVKVDATTGQLLLEVDGVLERFTVTSLQEAPSYGAAVTTTATAATSENATDTATATAATTTFLPRLWIGGVFKEELKEEEMMGRIANFRGCLKKVRVMSGASSVEMTGHAPLRSAEHRGVRELCRTNCNDRYHNICSPGSFCVEHFDHSTCNCFGSGKDGRRCENPDIPVLSLNNDGHVVHRLYDWMDRVHSYNNIISLQFRTRFTDSILFFASAEHPEKQYIAATLTSDGSVYVEANLGGGAVSAVAGEQLQTSTWQTLTVVHLNNKLQVVLNSRLYKTLDIPGEVKYLHLDPDFYLGSAPDLNLKCGLQHDKGMTGDYDCNRNETRWYYDPRHAACHSFIYSGCGGNDNNFPTHDDCVNACRLRGLRSMHSFLGFMRNVYFNDVSILWELKQGNKTTRYHGMSDVVPFTSTYQHHDQMVLLTLSTERAHVNLTHHGEDTFRLAVSFRPTTPRGVVASGYLDIIDTRSTWEIHHNEKHVVFLVHENKFKVKPRTKIEIGNWQFVDVWYKGGHVVMRVNHQSLTMKPPQPLTFKELVILGLGPTDDFPGMVGCVRKLEIGGKTVDLRSLVGTSLAHKDVIYDGCRVLGPCQRPGACEHGTTCSVRDEEVHCDCGDSGYTGKTCHFALYKKSCEQYRQIGYNTSGVYKIDVDGNGPLPPAFVRCYFSSITGVTKTIVEHNLVERFPVRGGHLGNFKLEVQYRDFRPDMLQALVHESQSCKQIATYECRRSPLSLSTHTWFSSPSERFITSFGSNVPGLCRCSEVNACDKDGIACNCDAVDGMAREDVAVFRDPKQLPLTSLVFLEDREGRREESEGVLTLGPLTCTKEAVKEQVVSFTGSGSYLEVLAWREGSLSFSFKTTSPRAVMAYQPAHHPSHATFRIALIEAREVEIMYVFNRHHHRHTLTIADPLNDGRWHQVLVDIYNHQLRLVVNSEQKLIDIDPHAKMGFLDGSLFLGGMPPKHPHQHHHSHQDHSNHHDHNSHQDHQDHSHNHHHGERKHRGAGDIEIGGHHSYGVQGLVGCIRDLTLNDEMVDLDRYIRAAPHGVSSSCTPSCNPNPCRNGATCIEGWGTYECVCANPLAHSGTNCEMNLNEDGITFITEESKIRQFVNDTDRQQWSDSLVNSTSLLLNFRTHADEGLIVFAYDYLHNFLQLHLAASNELTLFYNHGKEANSLTVQTPEGVTLNGGQSVQVAVDRSLTATTLTVFTGGAFYNASIDAGFLLLKDEEYEQFPFGESTPLPMMVYYPHSFTKPTPFFHVYWGSAEDPRFDVRQPGRGFVGCVRGLSVNESPVSLQSLKERSEYSVEGVRANCSMMCDQTPCRNGGICTEDFQFPSNFHCDCAGTSYTGPVCSTETAYTFFGKEWLSRDAVDSPIMEGLVFELAFSASMPRSNPQVVALLRSTDEARPRDFILVSVEGDGEVSVSAVLRGHTTSGKRLTTKAATQDSVSAFSGGRHVVRVELEATGLRVKVDGKQRNLEVQTAGEGEQGTVLLTPTGLYLGGVKQGMDGRIAGLDNFHGCISNVVISNPRGTVYPLEEYRDKDRHISNSGLPLIGSCAGLVAQARRRLVMAYKGSQDIAVTGEDWVFNAARREPYEVPPPPVAPVRNEAMDDVVPAVAGTVLVVAACIVAILFLRARHKEKKRKKKEEEEREEEERKLLLKSKEMSRAQNTRVTVVTATEMMPLKAAPNGRAEIQEPVRTFEAKVDEALVSDAPPPLPLTPPPTAEEIKKEVVEEEVQTREAHKESLSERPLSWDKSADTLPLIIGTVLKPNEEALEEAKDKDEGEGSTSEGSSFDCTIEITGTPPSSSPVFPPKPDMSVGEASPSSMRVQRGSNPNMDEELEADAESEPQLLRRVSLPTGDEVEEVVEPPILVKHVHQLTGDGGEVQRIVKSEAEDEIVVVDDYLDDKEAAGRDSEAESRDEQQEAAINQQQQEDLAEAAQDSKSETEARAEPASENEEQKTSDKSEEESGKTEERAAVSESPEEQNDVKEGEEEEKKDKEQKDVDSEDDFIELRPESEKVRDAQRMSSQVTPREDLSSASGWDKDAPQTHGGGAESEERIDIQKYYLRKKASSPPALPPKERHYF